MSLSLLLFSCSQDSEVVDMQNDNITALNLEEQVAAGIFDNSNLGIYEGLFTTEDGLNRATIKIEIDGKNNPLVSFELPNSGLTSFRSSKNAVKGQEGNLSFEGDDFKFDFTVGADGSNPTITNISYMGDKGEAIIVKETSKAAVETRTGYYTCTACGYHPELGDPEARKTMSFMLTNAANSQSDVDVQFVLNRRTYYGTMTQSNPQNDRFGRVITKLNGTIQANTGPITVNPANNRNTKHTYAGDGLSFDCSTYEGALLYVSSVFNDDPGEPSGFSMDFFTDDSVEDDCDFGV